MHSIQIDTRTLQVAIQAVAEESRRLADAAKEQEELWVLVNDYDLAAADLKRAYDEAAKTVINLAPYDRLIGESQPRAGPQ